MRAGFVGLEDTPIHTAAYAAVPAGVGAFRIVREHSRKADVVS